MDVSVVYAVAGDDIEVARKWIEDLTELPADARENDNYGSEYYLFGDVIYLHPNTVYPESEPFDEDFPDVPILVTFSEESPMTFCKLFDSQPERFTKLKVDTFDIVDGEWQLVNRWQRPREDV